MPYEYLQNIESATVRKDQLIIMELLSLFLWSPREIPTRISILDFKI